MKRKLVSKGSRYKVDTDNDLWEKVQDNAALIMSKLAGHYKKEFEDPTAEPITKKQKKTAKIYTPAEITDTTIHSTNDKPIGDFKHLFTKSYDYKPTSLLQLKRTLDSLKKYCNFFHESVGELFEASIAEEFYERFPDQVNFVLEKRSTYDKRQKPVKLHILEGFWGEGKTKTLEEAGFNCNEADMLYRAKTLSNNEEVFLDSKLIVPIALWSIIRDFFEMLKHNLDEDLIISRSWLSHQFFNYARRKAHKKDGLLSDDDNADSLELLEVHYLTLLKLFALCKGVDCNTFEISVYSRFNAETIDQFIQDDKIPWPIIEKRTLEKFLYPTKEILQENFKEFAAFIDFMIKSEPTFLWQKDLSKAMIDFDKDWDSKKIKK